MPALAAWLLSMAWPIVKKVLIAMGIGFATYEGLTVLADTLKTEIISAWGQLGGVTLQFLSLSGFSTAVGIILGAMAARVSMIAGNKILKIL